MKKVKNAKKNQDLSAVVAALPKSPGVYLMKNSEGTVIYVGKAKSLRTRVQSYFRAEAKKDPKTAVLVSHIKDLSYYETGDESEAFLLENNLIKKWKPRYNIRLKDDKSYPFIRVDQNHEFPRIYYARRPVQSANQLYLGPYTHAQELRQMVLFASKLFKLRDCRDHEFSNRERPCLSHQIGQCTAPCVGLVSKEDYQKQVDEYIEFIKGKDGPLLSEWKAQMEESSESLDFEKAALLRDRIRAVETISQSKQRVVNLNAQVNADVWATFPKLTDLSTSLDVDLVVVEIRNGVFEGRKHFPVDLTDAIVDEDFLNSMLIQYYSRHEPASEIVLSQDGFMRDRENLKWAISQVSSSDFEKFDIYFSTERAELSPAVELARQQAHSLHSQFEEKRAEKRDSLVELAKLLKMTKGIEWIDCIDISNFQGSENVASCVVFKNGEAEKSHYRKYKIKGFEGQNDFESIKEVVTRRYAKADSRIPDLIIIDGGKGQLSSAKKVLDEFNIDVPIVGLAKARGDESASATSKERFFLPGRKNPIIIKNMAVFRLVTSIRDEAHRFAITFHRQRMRKRKQS